MHRPPDRPAHDAGPPPAPQGPTSAGAFDPWQAAWAATDVWWAGHGDAAFLAGRAKARLAALLGAACAAPFHARRLKAALGRGAGDPGTSAEAARRAAAVPLEAIEPTGRAATMAAFDEACTDRRVTLDALRPFLADPARAGEAFLGRYAVWTSSGTTGEPGIWVHDAHALAVYDALESLRLCGLGRPEGAADAFAAWLGAPFAGPRRLAMVGATGGHFAGNAGIERLRRTLPGAAASTRVISILQPLDALVAELDAFDPAVIATYPTAAELLAAEREAGRLRARPRELWLGGEQLAPAVRRRVEAAFGARVRETYGASECMAIAWACAHGTLHLNADWVVLEPVDRAGRPVPPGEPSHTVLLTNLANAVQPVIRHDLGDSVTMLTDRCACGSAMPALRVEGRRDDVLELDGGHGVVRLLPLALVTMLEDEAGAFAFQLLARDRRTLALRLAPAEAGRRAACRRALRACLDAHGLAGVRIVDDRSPPRAEPRSGKLRRVLQAS